MKKYLIILALPLIGAVCKNANVNCVKAKVLRISCASFVVQVLDKDMGDDSWRDEKEGQTYDNVLDITNTCEIGNWNKGDVLYFAIDKSNRKSDCVKCMMYDAPPKTTVKAVNVSKNPCR